MPILVPAVSPQPTRRTEERMVRIGALAATLVIAMAGATAAQAPSGKVAVVTSFSKEVTDPMKKAFEKAHPGVLLDVQNRNTNAGVKFLEETRSNNQTDLFWASAPDAFEVLKSKHLLQQYRPEATEWTDLGKPVYFDHVAIAAPSRSGTTHLTIETILQGEGWEQGWRTIKVMAGNFRQVMERSFGAPDAVNSGQVGFGIVIDFFAFSSQASGFPVKFVYPSVTTIVPANIGIVANAPNRAGAQAFVDFLLSPEGQEVLLEPSIRRLPVNPAVYAKAPADYPNPSRIPPSARA